MLGPLQLTVTAAALFVGSTVLSTIGFGIGMASVPVLLLVLEPQSAVVVMNTVALGLEASVVLESRANLPLREIAPIALAGLLGVPVGVFILSSVDAGALRITISAVIIALALVTALDLRFTIPRPRLAGLAAGFLAALALSAFGVGGPLVALYLLALRWPPLATRASMAFYLLTIDVVSVVGYGVTGLYTLERLALILVAVVPVLVGLRLGLSLVGRMNEAVFRHAVIVVTIVTSVMVAAREALDF